MLITSLGCNYWACTESLLQLVTTLWRWSRIHEYRWCMHHIYNYIKIDTLDKDCLVLKSLIAWVRVLLELKLTILQFRRISQWKEWRCLVDDRWFILVIFECISVQVLSSPYHIVLHVLHNCNCSCITRINWLIVIILGSLIIVLLWCMFCLWK